MSRVHSTHAIADARFANTASRRRSRYGARGVTIHCPAGGAPRTGIDRTTRKRPRSALTLFELLIVMAVLILAAAFVIPAFQAAFKNQRLKKSADLVREAWARAKVNAIRQGEEFAFFYEPNTGRYWIAPFSSVYAGQAPSSADRELDGPNDYGKGLLAEGVSFVTGTAIETSRSMSVLEEEGGPSGGQQMILFYPDGTSQDAELTLKNEYDFHIRLRIRALTGVATVSDLMTAEELDKQ